MATLDDYRNLALAQILIAPTPATSGTSLTLMSGQGAYVPAPPFNATVFDGAHFPTPVNAEIVRVTSVGGDVLTIVRAQEGTNARVIMAGDLLAAALTKKLITDLQDSSNQTAGLLPDARLSANVVMTTDPRLTNARPPTPHHTTHETGGADAVVALDGSVITSGTISINRLPGGLPPAAHHVTHETGGSDAIAALDGAVIATGTVNDARLSANQARRDVGNTFTADPQIFQGTNTGRIFLKDPSQAVNKRVVELLNSAGRLYLCWIDDGLSSSLNPLPLYLNRDDGAAVFGGNLTAAGDLTEKGRATPMGHWIPYPWSGGNFTSDSGSWTVTSGNTVTLSYMLIGKTLWLSFYLISTVVTGTPSYLQIALPGGFSVNIANLLTPIMYYDGTWKTGVAAGFGSVLRLQHDPSPSPWVAATTYVAGTVPIVVN